MTTQAPGTPVVGFELAAGQFEYVDPVGVTTGPIVAVSLIDRDGAEHQFTLHPVGAIELGPLLKRVGRTSLEMYDPKLARRNRRSQWLAVALVSAIFAALSIQVGYQVSTEKTMPAGGVALGVLAGIQQLFMMIGFSTVVILALVWRRARRERLKAMSMSPRQEEDGDAGQDQ